MYAYVEVVAVTDYSVFLAHQIYANTTNTSQVILEIKAYYAHLIYAVSSPSGYSSVFNSYTHIVYDNFWKANLRYVNSLSNDPDIRITLTLTNYVIATVIMPKNNI